MIFNTGSPSLYYNFIVTVPVPPNNPPIFQPALSNQTVIQGSSILYELPSIVDLDGDSVTITVNSCNGSSFITFDPVNYSVYNIGTITIDARNKIVSPAGTYMITFDLDDTKEIT